MVSKSTLTPTLVLMAGLPGVGKSTLATHLGAELGWVVLDRDTLKDSFLEDSKLKENLTEEMAGWAAYETFFKLAEDLLVHQRRSIILDTSTLYEFIYERARDLASDARANFKVILCEVDERTRQHRLHTRKKRPSQAYGHLVREDAAKQFSKLLPEHTLRIWTKDPLKKYSEQALAYVAESVPVESPAAPLSPIASHESAIARIVHLIF